MASCNLTLLAQSDTQPSTQVPPVTAPTAAAPAAKPGEPPPAYPPYQQSPGAVPSYPPYLNQPSEPGKSMPVPTVAPPPVVPAPAPPGASRPGPSTPETIDNGAIVTARPAYLPVHVPTALARLPSDPDGSAYIPLDSWIYPELLRLYSLGYVGDTFLAERPYTRKSVLHQLEKSQQNILDSGDEQAMEIYAAIMKDLDIERRSVHMGRGRVYGVESAYTRVTEILGPSLRDSWNVGQTIGNDYGRPYQTGFNNISGGSLLGEMGPFSLYIRGELQHAPSATGYSVAFSQELANVSQSAFQNQETIPTGPISSVNRFHLIEGTLSVHVFGHEISGGKQDAWLGPGQGGALAWSNNADDIYSFRINRVEPLYIPYVSRLLGPLRYDFFYGDLKGHTIPNSPWVHSESFSLHPTTDFQFEFQRTVVFGGQGHEPVTIHTFLKSFFDINDTTTAEKFSRDDPGARFSDFSFAWRLPFVSHHLTLYADSLVHDDVSPVSAPRHAGYRTGLYLSQVPGATRFDFRVEGAFTDVKDKFDSNGQYLYREAVQQEAYSNSGQLFGDVVGREGKGGQAWLTYHLSGNEWLQASFTNRKSDKDFIPQGTTQNDLTFAAVKRLAPDVELNASLQLERWKVPAYRPGPHDNATLAFKVTWYPKLHSSARSGQ
jgi:hypothetical protein